MLAFVGRGFIVFTVILWVEQHITKIVPHVCLSFSLFWTCAYCCMCILTEFFSTLFQSRLPDLNVSTEEGVFQEGTVSWAACSMQGWRPSQEDAHVAEKLDSSFFPATVLFGVLDGHGGSEVSHLASHFLVKDVNECGKRQTVKDGCSTSVEKALSEALPRLDQRIRRGPWPGLGKLIPTILHPFTLIGCTACVAAVDFARREVVVANIGDSRAMLVRDGKACPLSEDHKPENTIERNRIRTAGGQVVRKGHCFRVDGNLNLSRALGDFHLKANSALPAEKQKIIANPDFNKSNFIGGQRELLVVACDGIFERCTNQQVADLIWPRFKRGESLVDIGKHVCRTVCARSDGCRPVEYGTDNETLILVKLPS